MKQTKSTNWVRNLSSGEQYLGRKPRKIAGHLLSRRADLPANPLEGTRHLVLDHLTESADQSPTRHFRYWAGRHILQEAGQPPMDLR